jgi:arylformamidase
MLTLLSHKLSQNTPSFAGGQSMKIYPLKLISSGGSSNNYSFQMPCHLGTHIDAPRHFDDQGQPIASVGVADLLFTSPQLLDIPKGEAELYEPEDLLSYREIIEKADILLLRSGFQALRTTDANAYSSRNPGMSVAGAEYITRFPRLRALGFDFISLSSVPHREEGRAAHRALLKGRKFFIIEDMDLASYPSDTSRIIVAPLFIEGVDSAPCTVLAESPGPA